MIEVSPEILTAVMLGALILGVISGYPLAIVVGAIALISGYMVWGNSIVNLIYPRMINLTMTYVILAVPCFVFMGFMIERSGIADKMYEALYLWLGGVRGGLASITVLIGTILAASVGIIGASIGMLSLIALPAMIKRGYDKSLACGAVCAGGCLGILIPPSVMLVVYGPMAGVSVGKLFMGAFVPGFLLSGLYIAYITLRCLVQPSAGPPVPPEERNISFSKKIVMLLTSMLPPALLIFSVLGTIFLGIAPPTEAAGIGAFASIILAAVYRKLNWKVISDTATSTLKLTSMIAFVGAMAFIFTGVFIGAGCGDVIRELVLAAPGGKWGIFAIIMFIVFLLGFFLDWIGIVFIMIPIITPISADLGFDPIWFSLMMCVNLQMSFMTPPFAPGIFFLQASAKPELGITTGHIIKGVIPFIVIVMIGLGLCIAFPQIILWLPSKMIR